MKPQIVGVIPARYASTRFPGKPLHPIAGKPLLQHVWERCCQARRLSAVIVATDDMRIAEAAFAFGAEVSLTSPRHRSGTDRIAEVARRMPRATHFVNIQGDEPLIEPRLIDRLAAAIAPADGPGMVTAANPSLDAAAYMNPNVVKVVCNRSGDALYFSRAPIPLERDAITELGMLDAAGLKVGEAPARYRPAGELSRPFLRHHGIYGYRRDVLLQLVRWKPTRLEELEKLEQLRALDHGLRIRVLTTPHASVGVDTPEDALAVERALTRTTISRPAR
jgi:3-deoxy-manno-octulosonate cytidylyltransferase (CMP-KDO synthetase)